MNRKVFSSIGMLLIGAEVLAITLTAVTPVFAQTIAPQPFTRPPTTQVSIATPESCEVISGVFNVVISVPDSVGTTSVAVHTSDGVQLHAASSTPYVFPWDTRKVIDGRYNVDLYASNLQADYSQSIVVDVANGAPSSTRAACIPPPAPRISVTSSTMVVPPPTAPTPHDWRNDWGLILNEMDKANYCNVASDCQADETLTCSRLMNKSEFTRIENLVADFRKANPQVQGPPDCGLMPPGFVSVVSCDGNKCAWHFAPPPAPPLSDVVGSALSKIPAERRPGVLVDFVFLLLFIALTILMTLIYWIGIFVRKKILKQNPPQSQFARLSSVLGLVSLLPLIAMLSNPLNATTGLYPPLSGIVPAVFAIFLGIIARKRGARNPFGMILGTITLITSIFALVFTAAPSDLYLFISALVSHFFP